VAERIALVTGTVLLSHEQIAELGRECREHVAKADAAIARARAILEDAVVSDAEADAACEALIGPVLSGHVQRAYTNEGGAACGRTPIGSIAPVGKCPDVEVSNPAADEQSGRCANASDGSVPASFGSAPAAGEETPHGPCDCACGCGRRRDPVVVVVERVSYGVALRAAVEDIAQEYGLDEGEAAWVEEQAADDLEDLARRGRMVHL